MTTILVTGSTDGLGRGSAEALLDAGQEVVVHARNAQRAESLSDLADRGARIVVADLSVRDEVRALAQELADAPALDAVIHNAGVISGRTVIPVNVVAPFLLTALLPDVKRHVYLSSGMHRGGRATLDGIDWTGARPAGSYSDSKLLVATLAAAFARLHPDVPSNSVDPGWVATKMGGASAPDDFTLGHETQDGLAAGAFGEASGGYWFHGRQQDPHPAVLDEAFQEELVAALSAETGVVVDRA